MAPKMNKHPKYFFLILAGDGQELFYKKTIITLCDIPVI